MNNIIKIIFSPTGGTQKAADAVANAFGKNITSIDLSVENFLGFQVGKDDIAVIAMPSFGGRAPRVAIERLKKIKANATPAIVIAVYGNRAQEDTLLEIADTAKECGFQVIAGITAVAEHSIARQYASGRPNADDIKELSGFVKQIELKLNAKDYTTPTLPGNRPYKKSGPGLIPTCTSACVNCKQCAVKCPVAAINKDNPKKVNRKACINCMRCVTVCPSKARKVNPILEKLVAFALKRACSDNKANQLFI